MESFRRSGWQGTKTRGTGETRAERNYYYLQKRTEMLTVSRLCRGYGYVALKIVPADTREVKMLKYLAQWSSQQEHRPGYRHIMRLLDHIPISARSGSYDCLVLEIVGTDIFSMLKSGGGLPYVQAKRASAQVARGLSYMHGLKICHGGQLIFFFPLYPYGSILRISIRDADLHSKNICFGIDRIKNATEDKILNLLGSPYIRPIGRRDGRPLPPSIPKYTVRPSSFEQATGDLKLVDFGQGRIRYL